LDLGAPPPAFVPPPLPDSADSADSAAAAGGTEEEKRVAALAATPAGFARQAALGGSVTAAEALALLSAAESSGGRGGAFRQLDLRARLAVLLPLPPSALALDFAKDEGTGQAGFAAAAPPADQACLLLVLPLALDRAACLLGLPTSSAAAVALELKLRGDYTVSLRYVCVRFVLF
jgi:hypothetical protein